uniref:Uncharacterized protein n=1 Tax=Lepeophtheirus salmonis TaxID=72036 RepID=A0A0K2V4P4_LEPSM
MLPNDVHVGKVDLVDHESRVGDPTEMAQPCGSYLLVKITRSFWLVGLVLVVSSEAEETHPVLPTS